MTWSELDLDGKIWVIPADRMKVKREHRVPLSDSALQLLGTPGKPDELVFAAKEGASLSDMTLTAVIKRMHEERLLAQLPGWVDPALGNRVVTMHGMRSSFKVWALEAAQYPRELSEAALSHKVGDAAEQAYARTDMLSRRREMMQRWAEYCASSSGAGKGKNRK